MVITRKSYRELINTLKEDIGIELRFTTRIIFVDNLLKYKQLVADLKNMADETIGMSDDAYCGGSDSVPNLKKVLEHISETADKNILITSVGEYLRFAKKYECAAKCLHSIMTFPAHSKKRVWIPIYAAKDIFSDAVGELSSERYELYELDADADEFECFVYSDEFSDKNEIVSVHGLKEMYRAWDKLSVSSGMAFSTKKTALISPSVGNYSVRVIKSSFEYIKRHVQNPKLDETLGTDVFWSKLASYAATADGTAEDLLKKALNVATFDAQKTVSGFGKLGDDDGFAKWLLWLWYKMGLNAPEDYLGFAIRRAATSGDIQKEIECAVLDCVQNPSFDSMINERTTALKGMGVTELGTDFWQKFDAVSDERTKLKLLSDTTHGERTKIIEIISNALKNSKTISDYRSLLAEKYPDLLLYFKESAYLDNSLGEYIRMYKQFKIMDCYDRSVSEAAYDIDIFAYGTRAEILNSVKYSENAYYLWIDGMGVEWTDMLIDKVVAQNGALANPTVEIGMAAVPTTTKINMAKADPETVSEKYNKLDKLSHIEDKSDCNYYALVDKQFELIGKIADMIVKLADDNPDMTIVVTADHGMSRMAAKAFHERDGITPPPDSKVENLGRYCILQDGVSPYDFANTYKEDNYLAYKEHSHFTLSGFAPGEIHGGASPEECLVPIIIFGRKKKKKSVSYELDSSVYTPDKSGIIEVGLRTLGDVKSVALEFGTNTFDGINTGKDRWTVTIPNAMPGKNYDIRILLNDVFSEKTDTITVKRRGLDVDDDF